MKKAKVKNNTIEFWRFIFTIVIVASHINRNYRGVEGVTTIFGGAGNVLVIFLVLSGYFLMRSYQSSKERGDTKKETPGKQAAKYLGKRVKRLYPLLLLGILTCFVARNIFVLHNPVSTWPHLLMSSILEMTGIVITGIGMSEPDLWFPAGWYISVLLVCGYLVYYMVAKDEDKFKSFTGPLIIFLVYGYWFMSGVGGAWFNMAANNLLCNGLLRGTAGITLGVVLYEPIEALRKVEFGNFGKMMLTIFNGLVIAYIVWAVYSNDANYATGYISGKEGISTTLYIISFAIIILTIIAMMNKDYISKALNNPVSGFLGKNAIYMYIAHRAWAFCLPVVFKDAPYYTMMIVICILTFATGLLFMLIDESLFQPGIEKLIAGYKKRVK